MPSKLGITRLHDSELLQYGVVHLPLSPACMAVFTPKGGDIRGGAKRSPTACEKLSAVSGWVDTVTQGLLDVAWALPFSTHHANPFYDHKVLHHAFV